jgi:hypothetical protein
MADLKFKEELAAYEARKDELLKICLGKFAVFKGSDFLGTFDSISAAYEAGVSKLGNSEFLIKQVVANESPEQSPVTWCWTHLVEVEPQAWSLWNSDAKHS